MTMVCTYTWGLMGASSTWRDSGQRPRYGLSPSGKPCLLMMHVTHTQTSATDRGLWTAYPKHVVNLASTISLKKTEVMAQGTGSPPCIHIGDYDLNPLRFPVSWVKCTFQPVTGAWEQRQYRQAMGVMSKLEKRMWSNNNLMENTNLQVYRACVLNILLYSSEA